MKGLAWAMTPRDGGEAALYAVTGRGFLIQMFDRGCERSPQPGSADGFAARSKGWQMTECKDEAHADRAALFLVKSMEEAGATLTAGPVEFEVLDPGEWEVYSVAHHIGAAAEKALGMSTVRADASRTYRAGRGRMVNLSGTGDPGDMRIDTDTGTVYTCDGKQWVPVVGAWGTKP